MINMSRLPCAVGRLAQRAGCSGHMRCRHVHAASPALHQQQHRLGRSSALPTAYVSHELMFWHEPGPWGNLAEYVQPTRYAEHSETKRRLHNLVAVSGLLDSGALTQLRPEPATRQQLTRCVSMSSSWSCGWFTPPPPTHITQTMPLTPACPHIIRHATHHPATVICILTPQCTYTQVCGHRCCAQCG